MFKRALLILLLFFTGTTMALSSEDKSRKLPINYPYVATSERTQKILKNWKNIKTGMKTKEVIEILDAPDEELPLYSLQAKNSKVIGKTYWYLLQRLKENGSQIEKNEKLIRISIDLNDLVTTIDQWGLEQ
ncbi:MAG: hypothetical protein HOP07_16405 [Bacteriovoracaceae bacterium]|nr:hypothetical protein [Bacteriovoracaceae bacterium]